MNYNKWLDTNCQKLKKKVVGITGSTGSIGNELCKFLVQLGADLVLINRSIDKTLSQIDMLLEINPNVKINYLIIDLEDINSIYKIDNHLDLIKMDYMILNAGAYSIKRKVTDFGFDNLFQINTISPYFLTKKLLDVNPSLNVILVGSISYSFSKLNLSDIDFKNNSKQMKVYGNSKRWSMFSFEELIKDYQNSSLKIAHPGIVYTNIYNDYPKFLRLIIKLPMKLLFPNPKKACLAILMSMFKKSKSGFWFGPRIFNIWGKPKLCKYKFDHSEAIKMNEILKTTLEKD